jgi:hypothetical protein
MGHKTSTYRVLVRKYEILGIAGSIRLTRMLKEEDGRAWAEFVWLRTGQVAGSCKHGNERLSSIYCREFLD